MCVWGGEGGGRCTEGGVGRGGDQGDGGREGELGGMGWGLAGGLVVGKGSWKERGHSRGGGGTHAGRIGVRKES